MTTYTLTATCAAWPTLHRIARAVRTLGYDVKLKEGPGFVDREFVFAGPEPAVKLVADAVGRVMGGSAAA